EESGGDAVVDHLNQMVGGRGLLARVCVRRILQEVGAAGRAVVDVRRITGDPRRPERTRAGGREDTTDADGHQANGAEHDGSTEELANKLAHGRNRECTAIGCPRPSRDLNAASRKASHGLDARTGQTRTGKPRVARYCFASMGVCSVKWNMLAAATA